jgi:aminoglycoside phosphotransferase (APT) family kinase protein
VHSRTGPSTVCARSSHASRSYAPELAGSPIPNTLVHGDFHAGNVAFKDGRHLIFDWTDLCIAHPFVDLSTFLSISGPPSTDAAVRDRLRDRYLDGWSDLLPHDEAVELFERTQPIAAMHQAISYQAIIESLDPSQRWEWSSHLPWWLTRALESPHLST